LHRMGAEPQRRGVRPADRACPGAEPPLAPPRPCGDLSAGHGLHRPNLISRGWRTARRWLQEHAMPRLAARPR
jgi:hypothetical protein